MEAHLAGRGAGRSQLQAVLLARGLGCTESEMRASLEALKQVGLIQSGPGRGGSVLTHRGQLFLEWLDRSH